ncbi:MAG: protein translocase subunit SecD [Chloroflexi bacterium]|nr:protein translocase subunit SecD [Chloroflexota bacterium]
MVTRTIFSLFGIFVLAAASLYVVWPSEPDKWLPSAVPWPEGRGVTIGDFERKTIRLGLDLQGGSRLLLQASLPEGSEGDIEDGIEGALRVLRRRVDASGVAEAEVTRQGERNISIQLPGLEPDEARELLGRTALLQFCEAAPDLGGGTPCDEAGLWVQAQGVLDGQPTALTGRFLRPNAFVGADPLGNPLVQFEWTGEGSTLSEQVTSRLIGQPLGIFLDNELLSAPTVRAVISDRGVIEGMPLTSSEGRTGAQELVVQLNSGALPVQLTVLQEQEVDATLGEDSVVRSVLAGEIGLLLVALFMILYYRTPGFLAAVALLVYTLLTMAVFKLIPVTLNLAGIAAFVLSVGMAVDANILIFERMKEELRAGRAYRTALDVGFARAWSSIRDSNVSTLITCFILFILGGGLEVPGLGAFEAPLVQGFAVTLAVGVLISMFSAITVTRTLMRALGTTRFARQPDLLGTGVRSYRGAREATEG